MWVNVFFFIYIKPYHIITGNWRDGYNSIEIIYYKKLSCLWIQPFITNNESQFKILIDPGLLLLLESWDLTSKYKRHDDFFRHFCVMFIRLIFLSNFDFIITRLNFDLNIEVDSNIKKKKSLFKNIYNQKYRLLFEKKNVLLLRSI